MKMRFAKTVVCLIAAMGLYSCGGGGSGSIMSTGSMGYYTVGENGSKSSPWGDGSLSQAPAMAVKFTPPFYPIIITSVTLYASNNTGSDQLFNLYGFDQFLSSPVEIFSTVQNQTIPYNGTSCSKKTINIPATTISSGSFHIAVEWVTKPLASVNGANSFFLCTDANLDYTNTSFFRFTGNTWSSLESVSATGGDLGIIVNYEGPATAFSDRAP